MDELAGMVGSTPVVRDSRSISSPAEEWLSLLSELKFCGSEVPFEGKGGVSADMVDCVLERPPKVW